ncbi:MAG: phage terminase large subunit [Candidatus Sumerlaeia bacterium]|nr:phage terminase large subunit [Candidatus Sumerlaeia bacterium]
MFSPSDRTALQKLSRKTFLAEFNSCASPAVKMEMMKIRCETDLPLFCTVFFPHHCRAPFSALHRHLFRLHRRQMHRPVLERRGRNYAVAAPRGYAKSTLVSLLLPIHDIVYGSEGYILLLAATLPQSIGKLKNIRAELARNRALRQCYAPRLGRAAARQLLANDLAVEAFSVGTELRGVTWRQYRPTKIILDDIEDSEGVESPQQREKLALWFNEVLENIGNGYTNILVVGTLLHSDSLLANILKRPDFDSRIFRAVESWAQNTALWEQWRERFNNLADPDRLETARAFFDARRPAMLHGAKVLWPEKEDYYDLMTQLAARGRKAFFQEKQNDPRRTDSQMFDPDTFRRFQLEQIDNQPSPTTASASSLHSVGAIHASPVQSKIQNLKPKTTLGLSQLTTFGFLDSSLGGPTGDFAAIATIGRDPHGYLYVLDVWMERAAPTRQIEKVFDLHELWNYRLFGFEANCFQSLLAQPIADAQLRRREAGRPWDLAVVAVTHRDNKLRRIAALETLISNGWLLFSNTLSEDFLRQCAQFPRGAHDDGLDALEGAVQLARTDSAAAPAPAGLKRSFRHLQAF